MTEPSSRPAVYLKKSCPFCLRLHIFLTEAGLSDQATLIVFDDGDDTHRALRERMTTAGQQASFPAAELSPGTLTTGTDDLIAHFAAPAGIDPATMPLLGYFTDGVFKEHIRMFRELRELKGA